MMVKTSKTGVYYNLLQDGDRVYYFTYKDTNDNNKQKRQKVGKYSEGFREVNAVNARNEQISKMKHGEDITVIANKKKKAIVTFDELAQKYFTDKRSTQNRKSRYNIHIKEAIGNKDIRNIDKATINKLLDEVEAQGKAPQTLKSIKELISTIWNHHIKEYDLDITNPCCQRRS